VIPAAIVWRQRESRAALSIRSDLSLLASFGQTVGPALLASFGQNAAEPCGARSIGMHRSRGIEDPDRGVATRQGACS
jgi:hypothetical protein